MLPAPMPPQAPWPQPGQRLHEATVCTQRGHRCVLGPSDAVLQGAASQRVTEHLELLLGRCEGGARRTVGASHRRRRGAGASRR